MSSPISTILANLRHTVNILRSAVYAIDVRDDIADAIDDSADAIEQIYGDVNSASLREDAFAAALQEAIDDNLLPIPATVIGDNSLPGTKIQDGTIPLRKLSEAVQITVDSALSDSSTNPVQNKVVKGAIDELNGSLANLPYKTVMQKSDMTNTKLIYKFDGDLYYYDGAAWQKIGVERTQYRDYGDLYTDVLSVAEVTEMQIENSNIVLDSTTNTGTATTKANNTIHFIDQTQVGYANVSIKPTYAQWSNFYIYDPDNETYTLLNTLPNINKFGAIRFSSVPDGCYLAVSSPNNYWKTGIVTYFSKLYLNNAGYKPKFPGLDEPITNGLVPITFSSVIEVNRYSYYSIDLGEDYEKYNYCLFRPFSNNGANYNMGFFAGDSPDDFSTALSGWSFGTFSPYWQNKRYINIMDRANRFASYNFDVSLGWINPKVAAEQKRLHYWGPDLAAHNADLKTELIFSAAVSKIIDIDIKRTSDGYYVAAHGSDPVNGHNPEQTTLEGLELEGTNYYEITEALEIMKRYGSFPYYNMGCTLEERAELYDRTLNVLGDMCALPGAVVEGSPLYGHAGKYHGWATSLVDVDALASAGVPVSKIVCPPSSDATPLGYTKYDWCVSGSAQHITSAADIPKDGSCSLFFMYNDIENVLNG